MESTKPAKASHRFEQLPDGENAVEQFLQYADDLYLSDLRLTYTGPGFASLHASSLAKLHVQSLTLKGFNIRKAAMLANKNGRLVDCVLDVSQKDLDIFYKSAPGLILERCRLPEHTFSWRLLTSGAAVLGGLALYVTSFMSHPFETTHCPAVLMFDCCRDSKMM